MHPGAVGGVERNQARAQQRFALLRLWHRAVDELEMLRSKLSARLLHQQDLAIDGGVHGALLLDVLIQPVHCKIREILASHSNYSALQGREEFLPRRRRDSNFFLYGRSN